MMEKAGNQFTNHEGDVHIPSIPHRRELNLEQPATKLRLFAFIGAFVVIGIAVWALAIAKLVDLYHTL